MFLIAACAHAQGPASAKKHAAKATPVVANNGPALEPKAIEILEGHERAPGGCSFDDLYGRRQL